MPGVRMSPDAGHSRIPGACLAPRLLGSGRHGTYLPPPGMPSAEDLQRLAEFLNEGSKIAILAGAGALHAREELLAVVEAPGAPIVKTLPGKATVPDDSPYTTGGIGLLGTKPSEDLKDEIDTRSRPPTARSARRSPRQAT